MPEKDSITSVKPCPFCGQADISVRSETIPVFGHDEEMREVTVYQVCCEICNAEGPSITVEVATAHQEAVAMVFQQWNQRVTQDNGASTDLKTCPFCDNVPVVLRDPGPEDTDPGAESILVEIFCSDCGATGPANDKDDLMELWNKRA